MSFMKDAFKDAGKHFLDNPIMLFGVGGLALIALLSSIFPSFGDSVQDLLFQSPFPVDSVVSNKYSSPPAFSLDLTEDYYAVVYTELGSFTIDLYESDTPANVNNFVFLSEDGFYNNLTFFAVREGIVAQAGDPVGDGTGGPGYYIKDEIDASAIGLDNIRVGEASFLKEMFDKDTLTKYHDYSVAEFYSEVLGFHYLNGVGTHKFGAYTVAMANSGPNTNGSQFFITGSRFNTRLLDGRYTVIGEVVLGKNVVDAIMARRVDSRGWLIQPVKIVSIKITTQ